MIILFLLMKEVDKKVLFGRQVSTGEEVFVMIYF